VLPAHFQLTKQLQLPITLKVDAVHNDHVKKWIRWQHFMAVRQGRCLAMLVWASEYELECAK
jgi:hypothetical protein